MGDVFSHLMVSWAHVFIRMSLSAEQYTSLFTLKSTCCLYNYNSLKTVIT